MDSTFYPCRSSLISKVGLFSAVLFYPAVAVALLFVFFFIGVEVHAIKNYTALQLVVLLLTMVVAIVLSSLLFILSRKCYLMERRRISVNNNGFAVTGRDQIRFAWNDIESISVIAYAANASKLIYQVQICISVKPLNDYELRRLRDSYLYGVFNQDKYVLVDYESIAAERLLACSHVRIDDLRSRQMRL